MKIEVNIEAESLKELIFKLQETAVALQRDKPFCDKIENKTIESSFFTEFATIRKVNE